MAAFERFATAATQRPLAEAAAAALGGYVAAAALEAAIIHFVNPTEWQLEWISDLALSIALATAVYLWRHLLTTRHELAERERAELVLQTQLSLAADIQQRLLPVLPPASEGFECAAALESAGKVGGDFYDVVETAPGIWTVLVADVSGKGIPAAMALGVLRSTFRTLARQGFTPGPMLTQLSASLLEEWRGTLYVTCIVVTFDVRARMLTYANAGHPPGMLIGSTGVRYLDDGGPPAALLVDAQFDEERVPLLSGDACLLVTDGVMEALDGLAPLENDAVTVAASECSAATLCEAVMARALEGSGPAGHTDWDDDRTVVVVKLPDVARAGVHSPRDLPHEICQFSQ
jgi:phosphoserine phosphatase RsbU/P